MSTGPGSVLLVTEEARRALEQARVIIGYKTYIDLVRPLLGDREVVASEMMKEMERCGQAVDRALEGERVALVSGGDAGIYAMAGLVLEVCRERGVRIAPRDRPGEGDLVLEFIPGIPALAACAALLGAPLMTDFASVSLSDLLTPWEAIEQRIRAAGEADFVLVLYNPKSRKRTWQLAAVRDILLRFRAPSTPVGIVSRAMREGERVVITTLGEMAERDVDMQTLLIVGNSSTYVYEGYMVTPRGYLGKYEVEGKDRAVPGGPAR